MIDASFISLEKVLPATLALLPPGSDVVALIKPQFEVGRGQVGKGGVVRDPEQHAQVVEKIKQLASQLGCRVMNLCESPILGPKGNREFLIHLRKEARRVSHQAYFLGAGPGDPELLTRRAERLLAECRVVYVPPLFDQTFAGLLAGKELFVPFEFYFAELISLIRSPIGRWPGGLSGPWRSDLLFPFPGRGRCPW